MSSSLVKLPDGNFVNPAHVTCIELSRPLGGKSFTLLWVKKNAGYGTGSICFEGDIRAELGALLNSVNKKAALLSDLPSASVTPLTTERLIELGCKAQVFYQDGRKRVTSAWMDSVDLEPFVEKLAVEINALFGAEGKV